MTRPARGNATTAANLPLVSPIYWASISFLAGGGSPGGRRADGPLPAAVTGLPPPAMTGYPAVPGFWADWLPLAVHANRLTIEPMQSTAQLIVEPVGLDVERLPRPLDWSELFGNDHPVEMEIGTGKGTFLTEQAKARPDVNFLGLEWARWFWRYASDRLRRNNCDNVRMVRAEASYFLAEFVPSASVSVLHIYFPDPWPKKRHHKRRLIQEPFVKQIVRVLIPAGRLQIVTDHADYFEQIQSVIGASALHIVEYNRPGSAAEGEFVGTNFERKYRREGRPFYALAAVRG